eukprot:SAG31_NODE_3546_length_4100_cov_3.507182_5_plen_146_part_00
MSHGRNMVFASPLAMPAPSTRVPCTMKFESGRSVNVPGSARGRNTVHKKDYAAAFVSARWILCSCSALWAVQCFKISQNNFLKQPLLRHFLSQHIASERQNEESDRSSKEHQETHSGNYDLQAKSLWILVNCRSCSSDLCTFVWR